MFVSMIDPSLFTIPYDRELIGGLAAAGHSVRLHGRPVGGEDNDARGIDLTPDFYRLATLKIVAALPAPLRLGIKGLDHIVSMLRLRSRFRARRPDIIHFQWLPLPLVDRRFLASLRDIAPLVMTVHDTNPYNGDPGTIRSHGFARCLNGFDQLIVHNQQSRRRILALGIPDSRISVIPLGLSEDLPPAPAVRMDGRLTFLMFGKIKPYKGIDVLIKAFALLPPELRAQATVRVVGKPYMPVAPLQALARESGVADSVLIEQRFVPDSEVNPLFSPAVIATFPYRDIDASAVLSFALANCCPVIASALGDFAERIEDGAQGLLVPPGDAAALAAAMGRMISDRAFAAECGRRARQLAEGTPSWDNIAQQTVTAYEKARAHSAARRLERLSPTTPLFRPTDPRGVQ